MCDRVKVCLRSVAFLGSFSLLGGPCHLSTVQWVCSHACLTVSEDGAFSALTGPPVRSDLHLAFSLGSFPCSSTVIHIFPPNGCGEFHGVHGLQSPQPGPCRAVSSSESTAHWVLFLKALRKQNAARQQTPAPYTTAAGFPLFLQPGCVFLLT